MSKACELHDLFFVRLFVGDKPFHGGGVAPANAAAVPGGQNRDLGGAESGAGRYLAISVLFH